ncbi:hypothetical protein LVR30_13885 [Pantoea ananatis]|uniref:hypothetical protein n=1 Tax=Pantoea ananas TaxID=553 RepID=UPI002024E64F|nr:hypothetical protein [Pantoea ananatis]URL13330.1 hypothetical protein LVR30_13885 [Pantoea ananatis]
MLAPKLKTNSLIDDLTPSLKAGKLLLSDLEKQKLLREARAIPERYQGLAIEGLIQFLDGKNRLGTEALDLSLEICPSDGVTWANYYAILTDKALYTQLESLLERAHRASISRMYRHSFEFGAFWGDMEMMKKSYSLFEKYDNDTSDLEDVIATFDNFKNIDEEFYSDIKNAARIIRDIAEHHGLPCQCSHIECDDFGEMSFSCEIKVDDASFLTKLNTEVIEEMVSRGYETGRCVAYFESYGDD